MRSGGWERRGAGWVWVVSGGLGELHRDVRPSCHLPDRRPWQLPSLAGVLKSPRGWFGGFGALLLGWLVAVSESLPSCVHTSNIWWLHSGALVLWGRLRGARRVAQAWGQHPRFGFSVSSLPWHPPCTPLPLPPAARPPDGPGDKNQWPGDLCSFFFQLVKKLSDVTGCTQVVDVGSGQVSQKDP